MQDLTPGHAGGSPALLVDALAEVALWATKVRVAPSKRPAQARE
jgi:hypothetical protein